MKRGTKTTPLALKVLRGNPRKERLPSYEPRGRGYLTEPPDWMDEAHRVLWRYALDHAPGGILSGADRELLAVWVAAAVEHARAVIEVRRLGQVVRNRDGNAIQSPFLSIMTRQALVMLRAAAELGFTPSSRAALGQAMDRAGAGPSRFSEPPVLEGQGALQTFFDDFPEPKRQH